MDNISPMTKLEIGDCALLYARSYSAEPWKEEYETGQIADYIRRFIDNRERYGITFKVNGVPVGMVLGMKVPAPDGDYFRIEDMCIDASEQGKGYGSELIRQLKAFVKQRSMDSIVLGTVKEYPSFEFYRKNGFKYIDSSALLFCEL